MEKQLFTWTGWDEQDTASFSFYSPTLITRIGEYPVGTTFKSACINYQTGELEFYDSNSDDSDWECIAAFKLQLQVVE